MPDSIVVTSLQLSMALTRCQMAAIPAGLILDLKLSFGTVRCSKIAITYLSAVAISPSRRNRVTMVQTYVSSL